MQFSLKELFLATALLAFAAWLSTALPRGLAIVALIFIWVGWMKRKDGTKPLEVVIVAIIILVLIGLTLPAVQK